eukprot:scaffold823_cov219-Amphora_coffeaeformis.AAC.14
MRALSSLILDGVLHGVGSVWQSYGLFSTHATATHRREGSSFIIHPETDLLTLLSFLTARDGTPVPSPFPTTLGDLLDPGPSQVRTMSIEKRQFILGMGIGRIIDGLMLPSPWGVLRHTKWGLILLPIQSSCKPRAARCVDLTCKWGLPESPLPRTAWTCQVAPLSVAVYTKVNTVAAHARTHTIVEDVYPAFTFASGRNFSRITIQTVSGTEQVACRSNPKRIIRSPTTLSCTAQKITKRRNYKKNCATKKDPEGRTTEN